MNAFENGYLNLLSRVLAYGQKRQVRNGSTQALFAETAVADLRDGFPMLTTRRMSPAGVLGELAGFLEGSTSLARFKELGCNYWEFNAKQWERGDYLGRIYGAQWRNWLSPSYSNDGPTLVRVDQLKELVHGLLQDPTGRRHILATWNPGELSEMALPPCHLLAQFYVDGTYLDCCVYMRSVDLCLGLPSDFVLYGALQLLVAAEVKFTARKLTFFLGDAHIYEPHVEAASEQIARMPGILPAVALTGKGLFEFSPGDISFVNYSPHPAIRYVLL